MNERSDSHILWQRPTNLNSISLNDLPLPLNFELNAISQDHPKAAFEKELAERLLKFITLEAHTETSARGIKNLQPKVALHALEPPL